jgi:hypothetical protein
MKRVRVVTERVEVGLSDAEVGSLDAWIAERRAGVANPQNLTRAEALRQLAVDALIGMGLHPAK